MYLHLSCALGLRLGLVARFARSSISSRSTASHPLSFKLLTLGCALGPAWVFSSRGICLLWVGTPERKFSEYAERKYPLSCRKPKVIRKIPYLKKPCRNHVPTRSQVGTFQFTRGRKEFIAFSLMLTHSRRQSFICILGHLLL